MVKIRIGSAAPLDQPLSMEVSGKDLVQGIPRTVTMNDEEVREALAEPVEVIVESVRRAFEKTPPELASDVAEQGLVLAGGGALIRGLDRRISEELNMRVRIAEDPLISVVMGAGIALQNIREYRRVFLN
jgi:rod shape-determining protein MreB